jgi:NAD+ diphosphatase
MPLLGDVVTGRGAAASGFSRPTVSPSENEGRENPIGETMTTRESTEIPDTDTPAFVPMLLPPDSPAVSGTRWFWVQDGQVAITDLSPEDGWPTHFLGMLGTEACWAVEVPAGHAGPSDRNYVDLRRLWSEVELVEWTVAGRAVQLVAWAATHRFCGRCGEATAPAPGDRAMRCTGCWLLAYPRLAPAVIALVHRHTDERGDEVLLARGVQFALPMFSCLAGFVEPGETLEAAVAREVFEEVGVRVDDVTYQGSQPWPFPHSLMIGFFARWVEGDLVIDPNEIAEAGWFTRDELPPIPPPISIACKLIDRWLAAGDDRRSPG